MAISDMGIAQIREGLASKQFTACEVALGGTAAALVRTRGERESERSRKDCR